MRMFLIVSSYAARGAEVVKVRDAPQHPLVFSGTIFHRQASSPICCMLDALTCSSGTSRAKECCPNHTCERKSVPSPKAALDSAPSVLVSALRSLLNSRNPTRMESRPQFNRKSPKVTCGNDNPRRVHETSLLFLLIYGHHPTHQQ